MLVEPGGEVYPACAHCGRPTQHRRHGRCPTCASYWRRNGTERPAWLLEPARGPCHRCGLPSERRVKGRCPACARYWWTHGAERPRRLIRLRAEQQRYRGPGPCRICGLDTNPRRLGRCHACYQYWWRTGGMERPAHLHSSTYPPCVRCEEPARGSWGHAHGLCVSCYMYRRRTGQDRPFRLIERARERRALRKARAS